MRTRSRIALASTGAAAVAALVAGMTLAPTFGSQSSADADIRTSVGSTTNYKTIAKLPATADASTTSFSSTSPDRGVGAYDSATEVVQCPAGWSVRSGEIDNPEDMHLYPVVKDYTSSSWLSQTTEPTVMNPIPGTYAYQQAKVGYHNSGPTTHHFHLTWWCDKVPASATDSASAPKPTKTNSVGDFSNMTLQNVGTGTYLVGGNQGSSATLGPVGDAFSMASDDDGDEGSYDYAQVVGMWQLTSSVLLGNSLQVDGSSTVWDDGSSEAGANGPFIASTNAAGDAVQYVVMDSIKDLPSPGQTGTGGQCLAASGSDVVIDACDATDPNQLWK